MYLLEHKNPSGTVNQFHIDVSEDGLMIYESCIHYVLENCSDRDIYEITGCENREALKEIQKDIISILYYYAARDLLPARCLETENRHTDLDELSYIGINKADFNKET
ncbi:hypothetical protein QB794_004573 [Salmonella enterica]|nr:hypothetical protein [Salmonella enterica subsp. enterica]EJW2002101.1 hypothetical protein [Salmonella enterica]EDP9826698.1 hypothetical protein [Salmonella enterica subsp. enterica]EJW2035539.1 hypothetical protein [Salmonella enterica]EJW2040070.1 hypothetical protein [Salmonella enterica]